MAVGRINIDGFIKRSHLLLHMDGSNNGTTFTDSGLLGRTITAGGDAKTVTAQKKFGTTSGCFDGSGDYIYCDGAFVIGDKSFGVDFWLYPTSAAADCGIFSTFLLGAASTGSNGFTAVFSTARAIKLYHNGTFIITTTELLTLNAWNHVAIVRSGNTVTVYINGVSGGSASMSANLTASGFVMGRYNDAASGYYTGYIDEVRVLIGEIPWTSGFTPPVAPYVY